MTPPLPRPLRRAPNEVLCRWPSRSPTPTESSPTSPGRSSKGTRLAPRPGPVLEDPRGVTAHLLGRDGRPRVDGSAPSRGVRRLGLRAARTRGGASKSWAAPVAPGPFLPTVIASAVIDRTGSDAQRARYLPGLADGTRTGAVAPAGSRVAQRTVALSGRRHLVLGGGLADLLLVPVGDDLVIVERAAAGRHRRRRPPCLDPTRRLGRVSFDGVAVADDHVSPGAAAPVARTSPGCSPRPRPSAARTSASSRVGVRQGPPCSSGARSGCSRR